MRLRLTWQGRWIIVPHTAKRRKLRPRLPKGRGFLFVAPRSENFCPTNSARLCKRSCYASPVGPREDRSGVIDPTTQRCRVPTRHVWGRGKAVGVQWAGGFAEGDAALACGNRLANPCQRSPTPLRSISQPPFITCVCEGAHKLVAFQSNLQAFLLDPYICPRRAGIHSGSN